MREIIKMRKHVGLMKQCGIAGAAFKYCPCAELVGVILVWSSFKVARRSLPAARGPSAKRCKKILGLTSSDNVKVG